MKYFITTSLWRSLLLDVNKKTILKELKICLQDGHKFSTSVYSLLGLFTSLPESSAEKKRTILHLIEQLVDEILPVEKTILEILTSRSQVDCEIDIESNIALLAGMDQILFYLQSDLVLSSVLPLRNLFRKTH